MATLAQVEALLGVIGPEMTKLSTDVGTLIDKLTAAGTIPDADLALLQGVANSAKAVDDKIQGVINPPSA